MTITLKGSGEAIIDFLGCDPIFQKEFEINDEDNLIIKVK